jgi:hypothetical protein
MIILEHNLDPRRFKWLWAKYVRGVNDAQHCTNSLRGPYSKKFSKLNPGFAAGARVTFDEQSPASFQAIYICGVSSRGYPRRENYLHNLHAAIIPTLGAEDAWEFDKWRLRITNGVFSQIPALEQIPECYRTLPDPYTTCRIFRWAVQHKQNVAIRQEPAR